MENSEKVERTGQGKFQSSFRSIFPMSQKRYHDSRGIIHVDTRIFVDLDGAREFAGHPCLRASLERLAWPLPSASESGFEGRNGLTLVDADSAERVEQG